jgi:ribonuclease BN (tRNA processing enzyme)
VSYSLVQRLGDKVLRHTVIDCGKGVIPSLLDFEQSHGIHVVHEVLLTHPHLDHFAQLDWLSMCLVRSGRSDQPRPLAIYASQSYSGHTGARLLLHVCRDRPRGAEGAKAFRPCAGSGDVPALKEQND